ncbi:MAG TPA: DUF2079 domain-containing protein [bacterium]|nr:DUF2079 domain-containing protein [bacterium]
MSFQSEAPRRIPLVLASFFAAGVLLGIVGWRCARLNPTESVAVCHEFKPGDQSLPRDFIEQVGSLPVAWLLTGQGYPLEGIPEGVFEVKLSVVMPSDWDPMQCPLVLVTPDGEKLLDLEEPPRPLTETHQKIRYSGRVTWSQFGPFGIRCAAEADTVGVLSLRLATYAGYASKIGYFIFQFPSGTMHLYAPATVGLIGLLFWGWLFSWAKFLFFSERWDSLRQRLFILFVWLGPGTLALVELVSTAFTPCRLILTPFGLVSVGIAPMFVGWLVITLGWGEKPVVPDPFNQAGGFLLRCLRGISVKAHLDWGVAVVALAGLVFAVLVSCMSFYRHAEFHTHAFDLGVVSNDIWNTAHGRLFETSLLPWSHLGEHFALVYLFLAPLYWIWADPRMLIAVQAVFLGLSAVPLYVFGRKILGRKWLAALVAVGYLNHPGLRGIALSEVHQIGFYPMFFLAAMCLLFDGAPETWQRRRPRHLLAFLIVIALAVSIREDLALAAMFLGLYLMTQRGRRLFGLQLSVGSLVCFLLLVLVVIPYFRGQPYSHIQRYDEMGGTFSGIASNLFLHPLQSFRLMMSEQRSTLIREALKPVLYLPVLSGWAFILVLSSLGGCLLSSNAYVFSLFTHYPGLWIAPIYVTTILALHQVFRRMERFRSSGSSLRIVLRIVGLVFFLVLIVAALFPSSSVPPWKTVASRSRWEKVYRRQSFSEPARTLLKRFDQPEASVSAQAMFVPHLANRREIYHFPDGGRTDYLLVDIGLESTKYPFMDVDFRKILIERIEEGNYGLVDREATVCLLKRDAPRTDADAALIQDIKTWAIE